MTTVAGFRTILLPATDVAASRELYRGLLDAKPSVDEPSYVGFDVDGQHVGLVPGTSAVRPHLHVGDIGAAVGAVTSAGGSVVEPVREVGAGRRVAVVRDPAGAEIGLLQDPA